MVRTVLSLLRPRFVLVRAKIPQSLVVKQTNKKLGWGISPEQHNLTRPPTTPLKTFCDLRQPTINRMVNYGIIKETERFQDFKYRYQLNKVSIHPGGAGFSPDSWITCLYSSQESSSKWGWLWMCSGTRLEGRIWLNSQCGYHTHTPAFLFLRVSTPCNDFFKRLYSTSQCIFKIYLNSQEIL